MVLEKLREKIKIPKSEKVSEEFLEIDESSLGKEQKVNVRVENLQDYLGTERVQQMVREGNVVFLKIKDLRTRDITELKKSVDRLKKTCNAMGGDIVGIDEDYLIITPHFAKVFRGKVA